MPLWGSAIYSPLSGHWLNGCYLVLLLCTQGTYHYVVERVGAQISKGPFAKGYKSRCGWVPRPKTALPNRAPGARHPHRSSAKAPTWVYFPFCWLGSCRPGAGPGGAGVARRCMLPWRSQQPKHGLHTPPELWNAFGACGGLLGAKCHSRLPTSSNSLLLELKRGGLGGLNASPWGGNTTTCR
jgi:hypothetical protein